MKANYFILVLFLTTNLFCQKQQKQNLKNISQVEIVDAFPNIADFENPVFLTNDGTDNIYIVEQSGRVWLIEKNGTNNFTRKLFLDITERVDDSYNEMGLLSIVFHPNYLQNKFFYVNYTASPPRRTVISRFTLSTNDTTVADSTSEFIILEIGQPAPNHNGGLNLFGADGYMYIGMGDGGPSSYGQNMNSLLGKMLRINVDSISPPLNYSIPEDNPFVGNQFGYREEIFATGMRNPWRFSFDKVTQLLYCADVGQNSWEEIDIIKSGKNYGWRCYEGNHTYNLTGCGNISSYTFPIKEYSHSEGSSITGGYVYRGNDVSELYGKYIYADFVSGKIWSLKYHDTIVTEDNLLMQTSHYISSFGEDINSELYFCDLYDGRIYKFVGTPLTQFLITATAGENGTINPNGNVVVDSGANMQFTFFPDFEYQVDSVVVDGVRVDSTTSYTFYNVTENHAINVTFTAILGIDENVNMFGFGVLQNYPNPFNPKTKIKYEIAKSGFVNLKVFDVLGNEIKTLVNEFQNVGNYEIDFDANNLNSGIYFYKLTTNHFSEMKKMILVK